MRKFFTFTLAVWASQIVSAEADSGSSRSRAREGCLTGLHAKSISQLTGHGPAQSYCSRQYPIATTTVTSCATATSIPTRQERVRRKAQKANSKDKWNEPQSNDYNDPNDQAQAFTRLRQAPSATQEAICNCLSTSPSTITTITTSCPTNQVCDATGTCKPARNCHNPARCDSQSYCLEAAAGACFCHPDTEDSSQGYCMSGGPPDQGCPESYEDCSTNADCKGSRVCIYACCREEPFCVDVDDYNPNTPNPASTKLLFGRWSLAVVDERLGLNPQ